MSIIDITKITTQDILNPENMVDGKGDDSDNPNVLDDQNDKNPDPEKAKEKVEAAGNPNTEEPGEYDQKDQDDNQGDDSGDGDSDEKSEVDQVMEYFGITKEEVGDLENNGEGLAKLADYRAQKTLENTFQRFYEDFPSIYNLQIHLEAGGTEREYFEKMYGNSDVSVFDEKTEAGQIAVVNENSRRKGISDADTKELIELWKKNGTIEAKAKEFKDAIAAADNGLRENEIKRLEAEKEQRIRKEEEYQKSVVSTISAGKLGVFELPIAERRAFYDWMSKPDKDGMTARSKIRSKLTVEDSLALEYIIFKEFNVGGLKKATVKPGVPTFGKKQKIAPDKVVKPPKNNVSQLENMTISEVFSHV